MRFPMKMAAGAGILALSLAGCRWESPWKRRGAVPPQLESSTPDSSSAPVPSPAGKYGDFQQIFADVAEAVLPAVVSIQSEKHVAGDGGKFGELFEGSPFEYFFGAPAPGNKAPRETGLGSGVVIDSDGTILTNNHVIEGADRIRLQFYDGREFEAERVGADKPSDLAVVRIRGAKGRFACVRLGDSERLRVGEWVIAVGSPYGLSQTVTTGIISAKGRHNTGINSYENFLQTDAAINPGNSGGALLNLRGELVGINTAIFSRSGGYQGIGFAIPVNMARKISADLIRDGEVTRGWLGVSIQALDPELAQALGVKDRKGALVGGVVPGGPADKAGLKRGDVITQVGAAAIRDANDLLNLVALQAPGSWTEVAVNRDGRELSFKVKVAKRDENRMVSFRDMEEDGASSLAALGLRLEDVSARLRRTYGLDPALAQGAVVVGVDAGGRAAQARLREGDVILEVNRARIRVAADFQEVLQKVGKGNRILLLVSRNGGTFFTTL